MRSSPAWILTVLTIVNITNYIDRQLISVLLPSIKVELHLTDTQIGLVTGMAFAIFYAFMGLPLAWLADRVDRRKLLASVVALWSVMTALTGRAGSFPQLMLCRIGVAVGEAGGSPPSYAIVSDAFAPRVRASAMSIFTTSGPLGGFVGLLAGGWIAQYWGWRSAFSVAGLAGVAILPLLIFGMRDPRRARAEGEPAWKPATSFRQAMRRLWGCRTFLPLATAGGFSAFVTYSLQVWTPSLLSRSYGLSTGLIGTLMAGFSLFGGVGGTLFGGYLARRIGERDVRAWVLAPAAGFLAAIPFLLFAILVRDLWLSVGSLQVAYFGIFFYPGPLYASINTIVPRAMRSTASATLLLVQTLIGLGLGPLCVGMASDFTRARFGDEALRYAMLLPVLAMLLALALYALASVSLRRDMAQAESEDL